MGGTEKLLEQYRADYEAGDPIALHEAVLFTIWNGIPVPQWAIPELELILNLHASGSFKRRKGVPGPFKKSESHARHRSMHAQVLRLMDLPDEAWKIWVGDVPKTQENAFAEVAESLTRAYREKPDRKVFTSDMVKAAYYSVERQSSKKGDSSASDIPPDV